MARVEARRAGEATGLAIADSSPLHWLGARRTPCSAGFDAGTGDASAAAAVEPWDAGERALAMVATRERARRNGAGGARTAARRDGVIGEALIVAAMKA